LLDFIRRGKPSLAPMAGVADRAMRELCMASGAAFCVSEMVSAKGYILGDKTSAKLLRITPAEAPMGVQFFGDSPETVADAVRKLLAEGIEDSLPPAFIDINMGCPAPKITHGGAGSALLKEPMKCERMVLLAGKAAGNIPLSVKLRTGWDAEHITAPEIAKRCEAAGAAFVTIHGRHKQQMFAPPVDIDSISAVKQAVQIPVIANGDVQDSGNAAYLLEATGCDAVMIGRGAQGRPWAFREDGSIAPSLRERMELMLEHTRRLCLYKGEYIGMREARKHAAWYTKGVRGAAALRREIVSAMRIPDLEAIAAKLLSWWEAEA
jgi:nifR3 family TIM-barrel protein